MDFVQKKINHRFLICIFYIDCETESKVIEFLISKNLV